MGMFSEIVRENAVHAFVQEIEKELKANSDNVAVCSVLKKLGRFALSQFDGSTPTWAHQYQQLFADIEGKIVIDCDADPRIPEGYFIKTHKRGGQFIFDPTKIKLYLSSDQQRGKSIKGEMLYEKLKNKSVLTANVLDYFLANPTFIPEELVQIGVAIYFWGTIYRDKLGNLFVRYFFFTDGKWKACFDWLDNDYGISAHAAYVD